MEENRSRESKCVSVWITTKLLWFYSLSLSWAGLTTCDSDISLLIPTVIVPHLAEAFLFPMKSLSK